MKTRILIVMAVAAWVLTGCAEESTETSIQTEGAEGLQDLTEEGGESEEEPAGEESTGEESTGEESALEFDGEEGTEAPDVNPCFAISQEGMALVLTSASLTEGDTEMCLSGEEALSVANSSEGQLSCAFEFEADGEICRISYEDCPDEDVTITGTFDLDMSGSGVITVPVEMDGEVVTECSYEWTGTFEEVSFEEQGEEEEEEEEEEEGEGSGTGTCADVLLCLETCGDESGEECVAACIASAEEGKAKEQIDALFNCIEEADCDMEDEGCIQTKCGVEAFACFSGGGEPGGLSCSELLGCLEDCPEEGTEEEGSSCEDQCFSSASPEAQSTFFAFIECGASSDCEDGDEACFNETCGDLVAECVGSSFDFGDGACPAILAQSPSVVEENTVVGASNSNPGECPSAEELEGILDEVDTLGEEEGTCKEPLFEGTEDACTLTFQCEVPEKPKTSSTLTFFEDGTVDLAATLVITSGEQTIECKYSGGSTWIPGVEGQ